MWKSKDDTMAGVYFTMWSKLNEMNGNLSPLHTTTGGYPHITIGWCGKDQVPIEDLVAFASKELATNYQHSLHVSGVKIHSFKHEGAGKERHDVLFTLDDAGNKWVEDVRARLREHFGAKATKFSMVEPHISHAYFWDKTEAENRVKALSFWFENSDKGFDVTFRGFTV